MDISELLKLWRVEKGSSQLAKMPDSFYSDAQPLLNDKNPYDAKKAKELYNDLVHMRQHKMLMACLRELQGGQSPDNLLGSEMEVYKKIFADLSEMRAGRVEVKELKDQAKPKDEEQETLEENEGLKGEIEPEVPQESEEEADLGDESPEEMPEDVPGETQEGVSDGAKGEETEDMAEESAEGQEESKEEEPTEETEEEKSEEAENEEIKEPEEPSEQEEPNPEHAVEDSSTNEGDDTTLFKGETENKALKRVRFVKSMPAFVGPDLESLGPFEEDEVVEMDPEVAEILLKNDAVELL
jgi:DNA replication initiation complex subunit (GINS family)